MSVSTVLLIVLLILLFGSHPNLPYAHNWGYYPFGTIFTILLIILFLRLLGIF